MQKIVKPALLALFGHLDTETNFSLLPPEDDLLPPDEVTRVEIFVLGSTLEAQSLITRLMDPERGVGALTGLQWHEQVVVFPVRELELVEPIILAGVNHKALTLLHRGAFDPRGRNLDAWSDAELRLQVERTNLAKSARGLDRVQMMTMISDDYFGTTGGGASVADPEDAAGDRLDNIYDFLSGTTEREVDDVMVRATYVKGSSREWTALGKQLETHRENSFASGRARRITELRRLAKLTSAPADLLEALTEALGEIGRGL